MKGKRILLIVLILSIALVSAMDANAQRNVTQTHTFAMEKWITLNLSTEGITIKEIRFFSDTKTTGGAFGVNPSRGPYLKFVIYNDAYHDIDYGVAIALFDKKHKLITTGSFAHPGDLDSGERYEGTIVFGPVNRRYNETSYFKIALEIY